MTRIEIRCLGTFQVSVDGAPVIAFDSNRVRALLVYLALEKDRPHRREALAGLLWSDWSDSAAIANLRSSLAKLREAISDRQADPPFLLISRETIQFNPACDHLLDVAAFEAGVASARLQFNAEVDRQGAIRSLQAALELYWGDFLGGISLADSASYDEWVSVQRENLHRLALQALDELTGWHEAAGELEQALACAYRQVELEPWLEEAHQQVMRLLALNGQRSQALAQYEVCRKVLGEQMQMEPSPETVHLFETIRDNKLAELSAPQVKEDTLPAAPGEPPFMGLQYFDEADAHLFFGREQLTARLVEHVAAMLKDRSETQEAGHFLAVVGASGSGKSSIVRAGLVPALKGSAPLADGARPPAGSERWQMHIFTPTAHPLEALAVSLTRSTESVTAAATLIDDLTRDERSLNLFIKRMTAAPGVLLVIDQFEELFTLCRSEAERSAFLNNLLTAAHGPALVIIALRADFYAHCAQYPSLRQALCARQEYIGPMDAGELRRAIEAPAHHGGWEFEPGLVELILRDVGAGEGHSPEPGALPLLSHALLETWKRRSGRTLTLNGYAEAGCVHGAIAHTAETVFNQLDASNQVLARRIFLRLTELGEGTQDTRRRAPLAELVSAPEQKVAVQSLLKTLADARLITLSEDTAEVAHEALIREWPTLREWLNQDREGLHLHRHLTEAAHEWELLGRDPGALYRGAHLAQAREWSALHPKDLNAEERGFLEVSDDLEQHEQTEREEQQRRELEAARKLAESEKQRAEEQTHLAWQLRKRAVYLMVAFILAGILAVTSFFLRQQALQKADIATSNELVASSISNLNADPELSILLALQAIKTSHTAGSEDALHRAVQASRIKSTLTGHTDEVNDIAFSPDGTKLASASADRTAKIWDLASGVELFTLKGHTDQVIQIRFNPDGKRLATASWDGTVRIWDAATGQELLTLSGHTGHLTNIDYSPDGKRLASAADDRTVKVWDAESGRELLTLPDTSLFIVSFSPDGSKLALGYDDGTIKIWDILTKQPIITLYDGGSDPIVLAFFSPDGNTLVSSDYNDRVVVWDLQNSKQIAQLSGYYPAFAPNGSLLAIWTNFRDLAIYDTSTYQKIYTLTGHTAGGNGTIFNQDGSLLATPNADGTVKIWDMSSGRELYTLSGHAGGVGDAAFSPGCVKPPESPFAQCGQTLATASRDKTIKIWDVTPAGNKEVITVPGYFSYFSTDNKHLITCTFNDDFTTITYHTWDMTTTGKEHEVSSFLVSHPAPIMDGASNLDGTLAATLSMDGTVKILDLTTGEVTLTFKPPEPIESTVDVSILASGPRLTTISQNKELIVWDARSGKKIATLLQFPDPVITVSFNSDGSQMIVTSDVSSTATLWNLETGKKLFDLVGHTQPLYNATFSPDGKRLVTVGKDGTAMVWDTQTGKHLLTLSGHTASIQGVVFSRDGTRLATGCVDGTVKLWDVSASPTSGQELLNLSGYSSYIYTVDFSSDGRYLASSSFADRTTRIYALRIDDLIAIARSRLTRSFKLEECQKYLHQSVCP